MAVVRVNQSAVDGLRSGPAVEDAFHRLGPQIVARAQRLAAKDTGAGAASIHYELSTVNGEVVMRVGPDREHFYMTAFVEVGTSEMPAQPALRPALEADYNI